MKRSGFLLAALASSVALAAVTVTATWTPPTQNTDGTAITAPLTYNIYSGAKGVEVVTHSGLTTTTDLVPAALGVAECVQVSAVANGVESARSNEVCATPAFPTPNAPILQSVQ